MKLTPDRLAVLKAIDKLTRDGDDPPATHRHIAIECGRSRDISDWSHAKLKTLFNARLIKATGKFLGSHTWTLTDEGKRVLAEAEGEKNA